MCVYVADKVVHSIQMCLSACKRRKVQLACETNHHIEVKVYVKGWVCDFMDVDLAEKCTLSILGFC